MTFEKPPVPAILFASLLNYLSNGTIPANIAKDIFTQLVEKSHNSIDELILASGYQKPTDTSFIENIILETIKAYPQQVADFTVQEKKIIGFFCRSSNEAN